MSAFKERLTECVGRSDLALELANGPGRRPEEAFLRERQGVPHGAPGQE